MKQIIGLLVLLSWSGLVNSALLSNPVIDGREWLQVTDVTNYSWNDFNSVCEESSGACNGNLAGGQDLTGWIWADINDFNALANHYIGANQMGPGADVFNLINYGIDSRENFAGRWLQDFERTSGDATAGELNGIVRDHDIGQVFDDFVLGIGMRSQDLAASVVALSSRAGVPYSFDPDSASTAQGGWFYRAVSVPLPSTLGLMGIALFCMRQNHS